MARTRCLFAKRCCSVSQRMLICGAAPLLRHAPSMCNPGQTCQWKSEGGSARVTGGPDRATFLLSKLLKVAHVTPFSQVTLRSCCQAGGRASAHTPASPARIRTASRPARNHCVQSNHIIHVQSCQADKRRRFAQNTQRFSKATALHAWRFLSLSNMENGRRACRRIEKLLVTMTFMLF